jgi:hypothetical protein
VSSIPNERVERLDGDWTLRAVSGPIPDNVKSRQLRAEVPGTVHTALSAADLRLATRRTRVPRPRLRGLDTIANVRLNDEVMAETLNQHRTYRFDVGNPLRAGRNVLTVTFASPVSSADRMTLELGYRQHEYPHPFNAIRKAAYNFGLELGTRCAVGRHLEVRDAAKLVRRTHQRSAANGLACRRQWPSLWTTCLSPCCRENHTPSPFRRKYGGTSRSSPTRGSCGRATS